jgi:hypothetical protein
MRVFRSLRTRRVLVTVGALASAWIAAGAPIYLGM